MALNQLVDLCAAIGGHAKQIVSEPPHLGARRTMLSPKRALHMVNSLLPHVRLEEHLQN